ncbi:hypothetical protein CN514_24915, partial [Bacillus sp. AFS001701]|uniref:hypothetical protein n=1 Tax=Bacillus sp. AFS001701 TaxID=2033480 RepID=UPI000BFAC64D
MRKLYLLLLITTLFFVTFKPNSSLAYNGYRLDGQNYGTFDYRDVASSINAQKGYMIVRLGTTEKWYDKQDFISKKYYKLSGIYKMKYDGLYTFEFYVKDKKVQSMSYYNTQPPKIIKVVGKKIIYEKIKV